MLVNLQQKRRRRRRKKILVSKFSDKKSWLIKHCFRNWWTTEWTIRRRMAKSNIWTIITFITRFRWTYS
jgi:hypothetical protein